MISETKNSASELMKKATPSPLGSIARRRSSAAWPASRGKASAAMFGLPIGLVGILPIPERAPAADWRQRLAEVVGGWGRGGGPFQRVGVPWVVAGLLPVGETANDIPDEGESAEGHEYGADAADRVQLAPARVSGIGVDAAGHTDQAGQVHRHEGQQETDEKQPEVPAAQPFGEQAAGHLREPVVGAGEQPEH